MKRDVLELELNNLELHPNVYRGITACYEQRGS